jgi:hypothetical protein
MMSRPFLNQNALSKYSTAGCCSFACDIQTVLMVGYWGTRESEILGGVL